MEMCFAQEARKLDQPVLIRAKMDMSSPEEQLQEHVDSRDPLLFGRDLHPIARVSQTA